MTNKPTCQMCPNEATTYHNGILACADCATWLKAQTQEEPQDEQERRLGG